MWFYYFSDAPHNKNPNYACLLFILLLLTQGG